MPSLFLALLAASLIGPGPATAGPIAWSPDGRWVAYTLAERPAAAILDEISLFPDARPARAEEPGGRTYRLWATRIADRRSILIDEGPDVIGPPSWGPDGRSLAFARLERAGDPAGPPSVATVLAFDEASRVVHQRTMAGDSRRDRERLATEAVAWSPDGRHLLVPDPAGGGLDLVRVRDGESIRRPSPARFASWSPDGLRFAYLAGDGDATAIVVDAVDRDDATPRIAARVPDPATPVHWSEDGRSIFFVRRASASGEESQAKLIRLDLITAVEESIKDFESPAGDVPASLALSRDLAIQCLLVAGSQGDAHILYFRGRETRNRILPFGVLEPVRALGLDPSGRLLTVRIGAGGAGSLAALIDLEEDQRVIPLAPSDDARADWLARLFETIAAPYAAFERPTILPFPAELSDPGSGIIIRRSVIGLGRELGDRLAAGFGASEGWTHARLGFAYLDSDTGEAARMLERARALAETPDHRERLLGLRAQLALLADEHARARQVIDYLRRTPESAIGPADPSNPRTPWPEALWRRHRDRLELDAGDDRRR